MRGGEGGTITSFLPELLQLWQAYLQPCVLALIGQMESIRMKDFGGLHGSRNECGEFSVISDHLRSTADTHTQSLSWNTSKAAHDVSGSVGNSPTRVLCKTFTDTTN